MKPTTQVLMILITSISALAALMIIWIAPAVGLHNSACERYPYTSGCR